MKKIVRVPKPPSPALTTTELAQRAGLDLRTLGGRLKFARLRKGLTQGQLADLVDSQQQVIQQIEANKVKTSAFMVAFAQVLEIPADWLQFGSSKPLETLLPYTSGVSSSRLDDIPLLDWAEVKTWYQANGQILLDRNRQYLPRLGHTSPAAYALCIQNDTMVAPRGNMRTFHKGDVIIVDPDQTPRNGCFVIALPPRTKEAILRQYVSDGGAIYLTALNSHYPLITVDKQTKILGVATVQLNNLV